MVQFAFALSCVHSYIWTLIISDIMRSSYQSPHNLYTCYEPYSQIAVAFKMQYFTLMDSWLFLHNTSLDLQKTNSSFFFCCCCFLYIPHQRSWDITGWGGGFCQRFSVRNFPVAPVGKSRCSRKYCRPKLLSRRAGDNISYRKFGRSLK